MVIMNVSFTGQISIMVIVNVSLLSRYIEWS